MADGLTVPVTTVAQPSAPAVDYAEAPEALPPVPAAELPEPGLEIDEQLDAAVKSVIDGVPEPKPTMQSSVAMAVNTNPDAEAEARRVAARTGVPIETVFSQPEEMKRKVALDDINFSTYETLYPASAIALSDVELAKIAHDDTENMGYLEANLKAGGHSLLSASAVVADALNPFTVSESDIAVLYKDDPAKMQDMLDNNPALFLSQYSRDQTAKANAILDQISPEDKAEYGTLKYLTLDPAEAAYLSPKRITGDVLNSLPSTAALAVTVYMTRGAAARKEAEMLALGATKEEARKAAIKQAGETMAQIGAVSEGAIGYGQQVASTRADMDARPADSFENAPEYKSLIAEGFTPDAARVYIAEKTSQQAGTFAGLTDAVTNLVGGKYIGEAIGEGGNFLQRTLRGFGAEGTTELVQSGGEQFGENLAVKQNVDPNQDLGEGVGEAAAQGLVVGGLTGAAATTQASDVKNLLRKPIERVNRGLREARNAEQTGQNFEQLNELAAESKLKQRDALAFQNFIESVAQTEGAIENIYLNPRELAQAGISLEQLAEVSPTIADQLREALEIGSDIKMPVSEYASHLAGTELGQAMVDHIKTTPLAMSRAEGQEYMKTHAEQLQADVEKAVAENSVEDTFEQSANVVKENIQGQLSEARRFTDDVNKQYATMLSNFYRVQAAKLGVTPEQFYAQHPITIRSTFDEGSTLDQSAMDKDALRQSLGELIRDDISIRDKADFVERATVGKLTGVERRRLPNDILRVADSLRDSSVLKQGEMTARGSFNPDTNVIALLRNADLSTFLHESGHFFLEVMNKLALDPNGPQNIKDDMQAVLDWLGVKDLKEWNAHDLEWQREKHEQFARGFEAYLFEGKSPSFEMRSVFQRFRGWLLNIYRDLKNLDVELSDEVRSVFDRMLATNEQIKETEIARSFEPMFKDAQTAGMNEAEWVEYQELGIQATQDATMALEARGMRDMKYLANARSRVLKDLQREAAGRRREVRDEVTAEVMNEPVNQARQFVTRGELTLPPDANSELKRLATEMGLGSTKLSLPALKDMYGEEANAPWRHFSTGKYGEAATEGLHPDIVAEMFGFSSGDELVRALLEAEKPKEKIAALTDQRMLERYGDLTNPEVLAEAADEAVHNEVRTRFVATELNALQKATGGKKILTEAAKRFANDMIGRLRIRDISAARYSAAETRAARAADKALRSGNLLEAAVEKRNQLIQNYASRAAHSAQTEIEKAVRYFKKFDRDGSRENIATSSLDQIDTLLERFDFRKATSLKALDKRVSLLKWKEKQEELGIEPEIPQELLDEAMRKHYKDMTLEELRGLRDTIKQIEHIGRLKNKLLTAKDNREFKATVDAMVASINENANGRTVDNRTRTNAANRAMRLFKGFVAQHRKVASLARELDGIKDGGPVWDTLIRTMNESGDKEALMREKATKKLAKLVKPILKGEKMGGKGQFFPTIDKSLNREERIGMALNMGNLGNMQRLLDGEGWTIDQVRPVLDSLTKEDWDFVQNVWDFFEEFRPEIGAKEKRVYGKQPDWIEPNPVQTKFGEYRGGYYPIKYDTRRSIAAEQHADADYAKQQMKGAYTSATTRRSFTKTRADEVKGRPLLYSMDGLYNGVNEIIHDLSWHEWLIDANRLLRNKALDGAIRNGYGADVVRQFKDAVRDIAGGEQPTGTSFERAIGDLRAGAVVAGLGFNIVNSVINITGLTNSVVRIGPKWVAMGVAKWTANPYALTAEVHAKSPFMRLRSKTMLREINEIQSQVRGKSRVRSVMDSMMFAPLAITQMAVDIPSWYGAYQKALTAGEPEARAVALADQAVLDSQSGGQVKDLSAVQRGGPIQKLFTTFYGYFNAAYNLGVERTKATDFKDPVSVLKLGGDYLMLYTVPAVLGALIKAALVGSEDDWDTEKMAATLVNEQISYLMGLMVGLREVTGAVQTVAGVNPYLSSYGGPAGLRFFQEFYKLASQIHQGEADEALFKSTMNILGILFRLPAAQINRTVTGVEALIDGETDNPLAVVAGAPKD